MMPFESLSDDKADVYLAEGIHEEIVSRLAKMADLKVISRTSTQRYQSNPADLPSIAKQLGVAHILKGSVQKTADQVRVKVQLINTQRGSQVWLESYERKLAKVFEVESEIAKAIAIQLQVKLSANEEQALRFEPTQNPEAYQAYLRALAYDGRSGDLILNRQKAVSFYKRAIQLDSNFAAAWAKLSRVNSFLYFDGLTIVRDAAERALHAAERLEPRSPETLLAKGYYQCWILGDDENARATFTQVRSASPGSSEAPAALVAIARRLGDWDKSLAYSEQAVALDPRNTDLLSDWALTYSMLRKFSMARKLYDRALDIEPDNPELMAEKASTYQAEGDLKRAGELLASVDARTASVVCSLAKSYQLLLDRRYAEAAEFLRVRLSAFADISEEEKEGDRVSLALIQRLAGDSEEAKATAHAAQGALEDLSSKEPANPTWLFWLSRAYAAVGDKRGALKAAERGAALVANPKDAVSGPIYDENLAMIQAAVGEKNRAIERLRHLLRVAYGGVGPPVTPALLRLDPAWESLRGDPAFQKLCQDNAQ